MTVCLAFSRFSCLSLGSFRCFAHSERNRFLAALIDQVFLAFQVALVFHRRSSAVVVIGSVLVYEDGALINLTLDVAFPIFFFLEESWKGETFKL